MTSRERVQAALAKQAVDRVPIFMWFHPQTARKLAAMLDVPLRCVAETMGNDVRQTWVNNNYAMEGIVHELDGEWHEDWWGIRWVKQYSFNQIERFPPARRVKMCWLGCDVSRGFLHRAGRGRVRSLPA